MSEYLYEGLEALGLKLFVKDKVRIKAKESAEEQTKECGHLRQ